MGYNTADIYYQPEKFCIKPIGEFEWSEPDYSFDFTVVWQSLEDPTLFYWARDSGCSCPSPFEDFTTLDHNDVKSGTKADVIADLLDSLRMLKERADSYYGESNLKNAEPQILELIGKVVQL